LKDPDAEEKKIKKMSIKEKWILLAQEETSSKLF